jgi:hypothetical protein
MEERLVDKNAVKVGAIERTHVLDFERAAVSHKFCVTAGHRHIIEENVSLRVTSRNGGILV